MDNARKKKALQSGLLRAFIRRVLPGALKDVERECDEAMCYTVVIGGVCVERCVAGDERASRLLRKVMTEDVDVKFVVRRGGAGRDAERVRDAFLERVLERVGEDARGLGLYVAQIDDRLMNHREASVRASRVKRLVLVGRDGVEWPIMDTGVLKRARGVRGRYGHLAKMIGARDLIPWTLSEEDGVRYASCEYVYLDTVRMLMDRARYFAKKPSMFALYKFYRYVVKFMALWVIKSGVDMSPEMSRVYDRVQVRLRDLNAEALGQGLINMKNGVKYDHRMVQEVAQMLGEILQVSGVEALAKKLDVK